MSRRYASRCYAGGLGPSRVRTRIPTTRRLGQLVYAVLFTGAQSATIRCFCRFLIISVLVAKPEKLF